MRTSGTVDRPSGFGVHDHLCWLYDEPADFRGAMLEFLAEGLEHGQCVRYVASGESDALLDDLRDLDGFGRHLRGSAVEVVSLPEVYGVDEVIVPEVQVRAYAMLTEKAIAQGFTGLRVAAEATSLVHTPDQRAAFGRYEHLIDRYMVSRPFAAMCAYDLDELGRSAALEIACMHPNVHGDAVPFRLHAPSHDSGLSLAGEVDGASAELLATALRRAAPAPVDGELAIDAGGLTFIDHHGLMSLDDHGHDAGATVVLRTHSGAPARLVDLLGIEHVRVEGPAE